jgi:hypothetical protein
MRVASWASIAAVSTMLAGSAAAMPTPAPYHTDSGITLAAGGCGYAYHRNVYGACVPNGYGWGGGVVVAPRFYGGAAAITAAAGTGAAGTGATIKAALGMAALGMAAVGMGVAGTAGVGTEAVVTGMAGVGTGMEAAVTGTEAVTTGNSLCAPT